MIQPRPPATLVLGPLLYHWPMADQRDFYFRMADEAPVDVVCVGEVVCPKRSPLFRDYLPKVIERLERANKSVIYSTPGLIRDGQELEDLRGLISDTSLLVEANDMAAVSLLAGQPFTTGPFLNVYNEDTARVLGRQGAVRLCPPAEVDGEGLATMAAAGHADIEIQAFGRTPLALSSRCYTARMNGLTRASCQYACGADRDGFDADTVDGRSMLCVSGPVVLSHGFINLIGMVDQIRQRGIHSFRLHPQSVDMVDVAARFREALDGTLAPDEALAQMTETTPFGAPPFIDGYYRGNPGISPIPN
ncbi:MAG: U32 family peptidase [Alphaproteobacteria bacterium]|jgi:O2-independent ubiquinone biosynthesis protein UbiV|nr:U32 family peptidase [Alphaproteobacteria bacterium]MBT4710397.1 U32 family peptidase [Alphaproteobacteria bacterium]MBT5860349.1 U32 family peptidase [Alphaproteobacteria bacterium]